MSPNHRSPNPKKVGVHESTARPLNPGNLISYATVSQHVCVDHPGDFATKVKQINSQSDLIYMSSFSGLSYLTIRSSLSDLSGKSFKIA